MHKKFYENALKLVTSEDPADIADGKRILERLNANNQRQARDALELFFPEEYTATKRDVVSPADSGVVTFEDTVAEGQRSEGALGKRAKKSVSFADGEEKEAKQRSSSKRKRSDKTIAPKDKRTPSEFEMSQTRLNGLGSFEEFVDEMFNSTCLNKAASMGDTNALYYQAKLILNPRTAEVDASTISKKCLTFKKSSDREALENLEKRDSERPSSQFSQKLGEAHLKQGNKLEALYYFSRARNHPEKNKRSVDSYIKYALMCASGVTTQKGDQIIYPDLKEAYSTVIIAESRCTAEITPFTAMVSMIKEAYEEQTRTELREAFSSALRMSPQQRSMYS